jgi:DNA polymerase III subunit delta'
MGFGHIAGQAIAVETLERALRSGQVHHAYRFEGPRGVGKALAAAAFARALLCPSSDPLGCEKCDTCRRAITPAGGEERLVLHPDVVAIGRGLYAASVVGSDEKKNISIKQIREVAITRARYAPHEAVAQVFIIYGAEELSEAAANALLKILEEPRPETYFVLITCQPERLLDTIRSRTLPVRFQPLGDEVLADILRDQGVAADKALEMSRLADGSVERALRLVDGEAAQKSQVFVDALYAAMSAPDLGSIVNFGEGLKADRQTVAIALRSLAMAFVRDAKSCLPDDGCGAEIAARRHALVLDAIGSLERNGDVRLCLSALVGSLRHAYQRRPGRI